MKVHDWQFLVEENVFTCEAREDAEPHLGLAAWSHGHQCCSVPTQHGARGASTWFMSLRFRTESYGNLEVTRQGSLSLQLSTGNTCEPMGHPWLCYLMLSLGWAVVGRMDQRVPLTATPFLSKKTLFGNKWLSRLRLYTYLIPILSLIHISEVFQALSHELVQTHNLVPPFSCMKCEGLLFLELVGSWIN